jgi:hypothetical protein
MLNEGGHGHFSLAIGNFREVSMKGISSNFIILLLILTSTQLAHSVVNSMGEIDNIFSYENLNLDIHTGYLKGTISNTSSAFQKDVRIRFDAYDVFKRVLWQTTVRIDFIKEKGKADFRQLVSHGKIESPLEIRCVNLNKNNEKKKGTSAKEVVVDDYLNMSSNRLPLLINGIGKKMSDLFDLENGLIKAKYEHKGSGHFAILLKDQNGNRVQLIVNEIGKVSGSSSATIPRKGKYFIDIAADPSAEWSVLLEKPISGSPHVQTDENKIKIKKGKDGVTYLELND